MSFVLLGASENIYHKSKKKFFFCMDKNNTHAITIRVCVVKNRNSISSNIFEKKAFCRKNIVFLRQNL